MHIIDYIVISVYLLAIVLVGLIVQKKASQGIDSYFLGNRDLPWWVLGASGMASNTDIAGTMINTAMLFALGTLGFFIEIRGGVVLMLAFLMIFMGKWNRRSQAMTMAEWMHLRFGKNRDGNYARVISAVANLVLTIAMISYFAIGAGKFAGEFLGINWRLASLIMAGLASIYTIASGLYGVVWTDVFQGVFIFGAIVYVVAKAMLLVDLPEEFMVSVPLVEGGFQSIAVTLDEWTRVIPPMQLELPGIYAGFNMFGIALFFYLFRVTLEGAGGGSGYMVQRYFAAKSDREAGLLSLFWTFLLMFRWPMIAAFAMLGIYYGGLHGVIADPELVLPTVINQFLPVGIKGLLIAGFIAAAMSTFDSTVNAGAAYWVKDIYQAFFNPQATGKQLMWHSRISSFVIIILGLLFSFTITNINEIWGWITMGIGAGIFIPLVLRWYWWRFNGYGFAFGTLFGIIAAILSKAFFDYLPEYMLFIFSSSASLLACIVATFMSRSTDDAVLNNFYKITRPFGIWKHIKERLPNNIQGMIDSENRRDIMSIIVAVPWQLTLFLTGIVFVFKLWDKFFILASLLVVLSVILYNTWYRHLSDSTEIEDQLKKMDV